MPQRIPSLAFSFPFLLAACAATDSSPREASEGEGPPPLPDIRAAAEWEPATGLLIAWPLRLPRELLVEVARRETLFVMVADDSGGEQARETFRSWGIPPSKVELIPAEQGDGHYATRDWAPFAVFDGASRCRLGDARYVDYPLAGYESGQPLVWLSRLYPGTDFRPDDAAPGAVARALRIESLGLPFAFTGGNALVDGLGSALATEILVDENRELGVPEARLREALKETLGVTRLVLVPNFERPGAQHVDCLLKLLDPERILLKRTPPDHPDHARIEEIAATLSKTPSAYGRPYEVLRIDTPRYSENPRMSTRWGTSSDRLANYTNSLILNDRVFVPLFGIDGDARALSTWRDALPGHEVLGFEYEGEDGWDFTDSLHCRTKAIWDSQMLYLAHAPLGPEAAAAKPHRVHARIRDYSRKGLVPGEIRVSFRRRGETGWRSVPLEPTEDPTLFRAVLPAAAPGATVEYYLSAASRSGRRESLPRSAPRGFYSFRTADS
jgi:agmatine deiminase